MTALLAGLAAMALVLLLGHLRDPLGARPARCPRAIDREPGNADPVTLWLLQALRIAPPPATTRRRSRRWLGAACIGLLVSPPLTAAIGIGVVVHSKRRAARRVHDEQRAVADSLPDIVDLLLLTTSAGQALSLAHPRVADLVPPPLGSALRRAANEALQGRARSEALLDALAPFGDRSLALGHALADHLHHGTPLGPMLERLGDELRLDQRRRAEERARRVPVRLLAPLVACVLPAFALLTVVPLLAGSLRSLST